MDAERLARCIGSAYETSLDSSHWNWAIQEVGELFKASPACMFRYDFVAMQPSGLRSRNHDAKVDRRYAGYYHRPDAGAATAMMAPLGLWQADECMIYIANELHREYIHDFAMRSNIGGTGGAKVSGDDRHCIYLGLQRPPGAERFGDASRDLYALLEPHMRRVEQIRQRLDQATRGERLARALLDRLQCGLLVCDASGRVRLANRASEAALARSPSLKLLHGQLQVREPAQQGVLAAALARACAPLAPSGAALHQGPPGLVAEAAAQGLDRAVFVIPIPAGHELAAEAFESLALLAFGMPAPSAGPAQLLQQLFQLSQAETSLLAALLAGRTPDEIARQRGVKLSTVRTQLHTLLGKTGASSQAGLANLARGLPPVAG